MLGELRSDLQIFEAGYGAQTRLIHVRAAELHGACVGRTEGVVRIVAGRTSHASRSGQRRIEKKLAAEHLSCAARS